MEKFLVRHAKERGRNVAFQGPGWFMVRRKFSLFCGFVTPNFPLLYPIWRRVTLMTRISARPDEYTVRFPGKG